MTLSVLLFFAQVLFWTHSPGRHRTSWQDGTIKNLFKRDSTAAQPSSERQHDPPSQRERNFKSASLPTAIAEEVWADSDQIPCGVKLPPSVISENTTGEHWKRWALLPKKTINRHKILLFCLHNLWLMPTATAATRFPICIFHPRQTLFGISSIDFHLTVAGIFSFGKDLFTVDQMWWFPCVVYHRSIRGARGTAASWTRLHINECVHQSGAGERSV